VIPSCSTNIKHVITLVGACFSAALFAACGGGLDVPSTSTPMSVAPQIGAPHSAAVGSAWRALSVSNGYKVLYNFEGGTDGNYPLAGLLNVKGTLYGTTSRGGVGYYGTVFSITTSGVETVLHSFVGERRGNYPVAGLINVKDTLYGTTELGGENGHGTVFAITTAGKETVLHSFAGAKRDGADPYSGRLLNINGTLYGTTAAGGAHRKGTVFKITTSGTETVLHSFKGNPDGDDPTGSLLNVNGTLYGTTYNGGTTGGGTVFSITTSGTETVLHSFALFGSEDGYYPEAGLINVKGTLYGTTYSGGADFGGTVFSITTSGTEDLLYSFSGTDSGSEDGAYPAAGLLNVNGTLYGTTNEGGAPNGGTVFSITTSGKETVLHAFGNSVSQDGWSPYAGLINVKGKLYGTTYFGGDGNCFSGCGTVFSLSP
jgi:uncharacterized repeat protein (TIGR03803 family)